LNEAQAAEQPTSQEIINSLEQPTLESELVTLKRELEELNLSYQALDKDNTELLNKYESEKKSCLRYYRQMTMLKQAIENLIEGKKITEGDVVNAVLVGQNLMSLDDLLFTLAD